MTITQLSTVLGAATVAYLLYLYMQYRTAEEVVYQRQYRQQFTKVVLGGLFVAYVLALTVPDRGGWPAAVGRVLSETVWSATPSIAASDDVSGLERVIHWLKLLGLIAYTIAWLLVSFSAQFATKLYRLVFGD